MNPGRIVGSADCHHLVGESQPPVQVHIMPGQMQMPVAMPMNHVLPQQQQPQQLQHQLQYPSQHQSQMMQHRMVGFQQGQVPMRMQVVQNMSGQMILQRPMEKDGLMYNQMMYSMGQQQQQPHHQQQQPHHHQHPSSNYVYSSKGYYDPQQQQQQYYRQPMTSPTGHQSAYFRPQQMLRYGGSKMQTSPCWNEVSPNIEGILPQQQQQHQLPYPNSGIYSNHIPKDEYGMLPYDSGRFANVGPGFSPRSVRVEMSPNQHLGVVCSSYSTQIKPDPAVWHQSETGMQHLPPGGQYQSPAYNIIKNVDQSSYSGQANALTVGVGKPNYLPGKRLEHYSPTKCSVMNPLSSPRMPNPDFQDEYPATKSSVHLGATIPRMEFSPRAGPTPHHQISPQMHPYWQPAMKYRPPLSSGYSPNMYGQQSQTLYSQPADVSSYCSQYRTAPNDCSEYKVMTTVSPGSTYPEKDISTAELGKNDILCRKSDEIKRDCITTSSLEVSSDSAGVSLGKSQLTVSRCVTVGSLAHENSAVSTNLISRGSSSACSAFSFSQASTKMCNVIMPAVNIKEELDVKLACSEHLKIRTNMNSHSVDANCDPLSIASSSLPARATSLLSTGGPGEVVTMTVSTPTTVAMTTSLAVTSSAAQCLLATATRSTLNEILIHRDDGVEVAESKESCASNQGPSEVLDGNSAAVPQSCSRSIGALKVHQRIKKLKIKKKKLLSMSKTQQGETTNHSSLSDIPASAPTNSNLSRNESKNCLDSDALHRQKVPCSNSTRVAKIKCEDGEPPAAVEMVGNRPTDEHCKPIKSHVIVPFEWQRVIENGSVAYYSPTKVKLESLDEVRQYLLMEGTCKCGLECPLIVERTFLFDHEVDSKHLCADDVRCDSDLTNLCNHKRKIVAMATFHHSAGLQMEQQNFQSSLNPPQPCKESETVLMDSGQRNLSSHYPGVGSGSSNVLSSRLNTDAYYRQPGPTSHGVNLYHHQSNSQLRMVSKTSRNNASNNQFNWEPPSASPSYNFHGPYFPGDSHEFRSATFGKRPDFQKNVGQGVGQQMPSQRGVYDFHGARYPWPQQCGGNASTNFCFDAESQHPLSKPNRFFGLEEPGQANSFPNHFGGMHQSNVPAARKPRKKPRQKERVFNGLLGKSIPCPNIDVRQIIQEQQERLHMESSGRLQNGVFEDGLAAFLAHQTMLVNKSLTPDVDCTSPDGSEVTRSASTTGSSYDDSGSSNHPGAPHVEESTRKNLESGCKNVGKSVSDGESPSNLAVVRRDLGLEIDAEFDTSQDSKLLSCQEDETYRTVEMFSDSKHRLPVHLSVHPNFSSSPGSLPCTRMKNTHSSSVSTAGQHQTGFPSCQDFAGMSIELIPPRENANCSTNEFDPWTEGGSKEKLILHSDRPARSLLFDTEHKSSCQKIDASDISSKEESPIRLVENMVSELVTTQNTLAMVTSMMISKSDSSSKRRKSGSSDGSHGATQTFDCSSASTKDRCSVSVTEMSHPEILQKPACVVVTGIGIDCRTKENDNKIEAPVASDSAGGLKISKSTELVSNKETLHMNRQQTAETTCNITNVLTQVIPTVGTQQPFAHPLHFPSVVQVLNPLGIANASVILNEQNCVPLTTQDLSSSHLQGLSANTIGQLQMASQSQMVLLASNNGADLNVQPNSSSSVMPVEDEDSQATDEIEDVDDSQSEMDDIMRTTGTQTSTPASSLSNCNSVDCTEMDVEAGDAVCPDQSVSSSTNDDGVYGRDGTRKPTKKFAQQTVASILQSQGQMQAGTATAQVVMMSSIPQQSFLLPQNIGFANQINTPGYLQIQPQPVDFCFGHGQVGLIHFGQVVAGTSGLIPAQTFVSGSGDMNPAENVGHESTASKSEASTPAFGSTELLQLVSTSMPQGQHILVQNVPGFAPFAGTLLPVVQQNPLRAAFCSIGGAQTLFAVSQGSFGIVTSVASGVQLQTSTADATPDAPDSTVDSEEIGSSSTIPDPSACASNSVPMSEGTPENIAGEVCSSTSCNVESCNMSGGALYTTCSDVQTSCVSMTDNTSDRVICSVDKFPTCSNDSTSDVVAPVVAETSSVFDCPEMLGSGTSRRLTVSTGTTRLVRRKKTKKWKRSHKPKVLSMSVKRTPVDPDVNCSVPKIDVDTAGQSDCETRMTDADKNTCPSDGCDLTEGDTKFLHSDCPVTTTLTRDVKEESGSTQEISFVRSTRRRRKNFADRKKAGLEIGTKSLGLKRSLKDSLLEDESNIDCADSTTSLPPVSNAYPRSFNIGDLVWGPARGFPSWPGKLVPETEVRGNPKSENGKVWVKWFGDHTFAQAEPDQLKTLSEGLDTHHNARKTHRKGRKMNANLEAAIQEAMVELDRQMAEQSGQAPSGTNPDRSAKKSKKVT